MEKTEKFIKWEKIIEDCERSQNEVTSYSYDELSRVTSVTNALGFVDTFSYDAKSRISTTADWIGYT